VFDLGFVFERGDSTNVFLGWDEGADKFVFGTTAATGATTGNVALTATSTILANFETGSGGITFDSGATMLNQDADNLEITEANIKINGNLIINDGTNDFNIASHDGTNGLKLAGTLVTATAAELNGLAGLTASSAELNYNDITTLGTSQASKVVTADANGNVTIADGAYDFNIASHDGTNGLKLGGTLITATAAELNLLDGGATVGTTTVSGSDGIVTNDAGTMKQTSVDTFDTYLSQTAKELTNKTLTQAKGVTSSIVKSVSYSSGARIDSGVMNVPANSLITKMAAVVTTQLTHGSGNTTFRAGTAANGQELAASINFQAGTQNTAAGIGTSSDTAQTTALSGAASAVIVAGQAYRSAATTAHMAVAGHSDMSAGAVTFILEYIRF
jgi:hypothetical protein